MAIALDVERVEADVNEANRGVRFKISPLREVTDPPRPAPKEDAIRQYRSRDGERVRQMTLRLPDDLINEFSEVARRERKSVTLLGYEMMTSFLDEYWGARQHF